MPARVRTLIDNESSMLLRFKLPKPHAPPVVISRLLRAAPPQVLLALLLTAVVSVVIFAVSEVAAGRISQTRDDVNQVRKVLTQLELVRIGLVQAESSQRGYLLTGSNRYLKPFNAALQSAQTALVELSTVSGDNLEWRGRAQGLRTLVEKREDDLKLSLFMIERGEPEKAIAKMREGEGLELMEAITHRLDEFHAVLNHEIGRRQEVLDQHFMQQRVGVGIVVLINLVFLAVLANMMIRHFTQREAHRIELQRQADQLERAVADRTDELSSLSSYLQTSSERERARLARDLHDELGGILTSAKIDIAWLEGNSKQLAPDAVPRLQRLSAVLDEAVDMKRRVVENLRPSLLDHLGLGAAISWHVEEICKKSDLKFKLTSLPDTEVVSPEISIAIYRTVQEGLTNVLKHAQASEVTVSVTRTPSGYKLVVADNGVGISGFKPENLSHGLAGMRQRTRALGGTFHLRTAPGQGTRIEAFYPLR
jgi:signal transduction histidine kinase